MHDECQITFDLCSQIKKLSSKFFNVMKDSSIVQIIHLYDSLFEKIIRGCWKRMGRIILNNISELHNDFVISRLALNIQL
jgi:hypothetical protein